MNIIESLNNVINHIEDNLDKEISVERLEKISGISRYHFQRIFTAISDLTLQEYIRFRKLSVAAIELKSSSVKIVDLALKYGYSDPTSFSRAFKSFHGITPSQARREGVILSSFPPLNFSIKITGGKKMDYKIVTKGPMTVYGISTEMTEDMNENFKIIPDFWKRMKENGTIQKMIPYIKEEPQGVLGVNSFENGRWKYYIGISSNEAIEGLERLEIPSSNWAVFSGKGTTEQLQEQGKRIFTEWLPSEGYEHREIPDFEVYKNMDPNNFIYEFWIPVNS